jgi:hypothetical protein
LVNEKSRVENAEEKVHCTSQYIYIAESKLLLVQILRLIPVIFTFAATIL